MKGKCIKMCILNGQMFQPGYLVDEIPEALAGCFEPLPEAPKPAPVQGSLKLDEPAKDEPKEEKKPSRKSKE